MDNKTVVGITHKREISSNGIKKRPEPLGEEGKPAYGFSCFLEAFGFSALTSFSDLSTAS